MIRLRGFSSLHLPRGVLGVSNHVRLACLRRGVSDSDSCDSGARLTLDLTLHAFSWEGVSAPDPSEVTCVTNDMIARGGRRPGSSEMARDVRGCARPSLYDARRPVLDSHFLPLPTP